MTEYELLERVKESSALGEISLVIVSSKNVASRIHRCLEEGGEGSLLKPLTQLDLSRVCNQMLQQSMVQRFAMADTNQFQILDLCLFPESLGRPLLQSGDF